MDETFELPDSDESVSESDIPTHFKPGEILKSIEAENEAKKQKLSKSDPQETNEMQHKINASSLSSAFENAFGHLKNSKYYEDPYLSAPSSSKQAAEKSVEKITPNKNFIIVNSCQRGNPLLKHIRNVPWEFGEIEPDYIMGKTTCALYLSLRYHNLYPNYIHQRLKSLGRSYELRVLLVHVDIIDPHPALKELSQIAILANCTLMLVWSSEEAGKYIETYKSFENKSPELIMEKQDNDTYSQLTDSLTSVRSINKTNAVTLLSIFGTLENLLQTTTEEIALCPGMGTQKASRLHEIFHQPFLKAKKS
ncbi:DNA excision repair protein ERCC-1 isoform X1 [Centruroides vittatus]|uniref:DNA excision repair protein ERCC-1 isoform X1 n=1 Tax=Centruroides vittatus TaxID=120091 RepID=UPI00350F4EE8